jgi:hypothetical protein
MLDVHVIGASPEHGFIISMPRKDKQRLEGFLRHFCLFEQWVYTLAGVKPVSFSVCHKKCPFFGFFFPRTKGLLGWKTWLKYQHYFQNSRFVVFADVGLEFKDWMLIVIVDRLQFDQVIQKYADDFQSVLHLDSLDSKKLLERTKDRSFLQDTLHGHDGLIGTILGYGRNNAWRFFERSQGNEVVLEMMWDQDLMGHMLDHWNKKPHAKPWDLSHLFYPSCVAARDSEESTSFRNLYRDTREQIFDYYEGKDFVEATLSLFNLQSDDPNFIKSPGESGI